MATYVPYRTLVSTGLDQLGTLKGLQRFEGEEAHSHRRRILKEITEPAGASEIDFIKAVPNQVALFDVPVFEIGLDNDPSDPYIEITSHMFRAYESLEDGLLDFEVDFTDRSGGYWLEAIKDGIDASGFFTVTVLDSTYARKRSDHLRIDTSNRLAVDVPLQQSGSNKLEHSNIRDFTARAAELFLTEKGSAAALSTNGDYYLDRENGVVFTKDPAHGSCAYSYRDFPLRVYWQPIRSWRLSDSDRVNRFCNQLVSDTTGELEPLLLNSEGARFYNEVLSVHPLGWGR